MKYDPEYNSYKFSNDDLNIIVNALYFYSQHSPVLDEHRIDYVAGIIKILESSKHITI